MRDRSPGTRGSIRCELSGFVGRRAELGRVRAALASARLVTLTGPGGIGKTRLAVQAATEMRRSFRDGAWMTELAGLRDPGLLAPEVARSLGLLDQSASWGVATLADSLAGRQVLLVLDNCEHLLDACAVLAGALLRACPGLRILTTSRQVLGVPGEVTFPVPPMSVPAEGQLPGWDSLLEYEAVHLFAERGAAVLPGFAVDAGNRQAIMELCRRLEGIPLAIELAAVRLRAMSPEQILARLADRFGLLSAGDPATPRHGTLQAALRWSYDLLTTDERVLWRRSSVFTGSFDLDAAESVCAGDSIVAEMVADLIDGLVAKSVLLRRPGGRTARYVLLDTIRDYGQQRLEEAGRGALLRRRHRDCYAALAAKKEGLGAGQIQWIDGLDADHDNLRAALEFCLAEPGEAEAGLRMACDLWLYWETRGHLTEGRRFLDALLGRALHAPGLSVRGRWVAGYLALVQGDGDAARSLLEEALFEANSLGDTEAAAYAAQFLGRALLFTGEPDRGLALTGQALSRHRTAADWQGVVLTLVQLGVMQTLMGHPETAAAKLEECIAECEAHGERWNRSYALWGLGLAAWLLGDDGRAAELEQAALRLKRDVGDKVGIPLCLEALAWIAASRDQARRAADLLGAATAAWNSIPASLPAPLAGYREAAAGRTRDALGDTSFTAHLVRAQAMPSSRAIATALGEPAGAVRPAPACSEAVRLTAREREVAALIAQGLSNRDIAARLVISARTAETHVEHIMVKLGLTARAQIAAWTAAEAGPDA
ncbi:MAG: LuxR family transcriptional regulator [Streptosporangiaceae bacterium]|nr:LuxR family transcriptional regulator [Streptosporangiaceae bacterium]